MSDELTSPAVHVPTLIFADLGTMYQAQIENLPEGAEQFDTGSGDVSLESGIPSA